MTDELKQILCDLIERHGRELVREPKRLDGMLNDACAGQHRGARRVLLDAVHMRWKNEVPVLFRILDAISDRPDLPESHTIARH